MGFLKTDPFPGALRRLRSSRGLGRGLRVGLPQVQLAAGLHVCFSPAFQVLFPSVSLVFLFSIVPLFSLFLPPFLFVQISFFASLLPRPLHQAGCPTSLSSAVCLSSSWPRFFPLAPCPRARGTLCFLLYRSSSFQCKINTV